MKIVKIKAGLGNQMFQYAFVRYLQEMTYDDVKLDISYYAFDQFKRYWDSGLPLLNVDLNIATKDEVKKIKPIRFEALPHTNWYRASTAIETIVNKYCYFERTRAFVELDSLKKYKYFDGYWQSWRYLELIKDTLQKEFTPKHDLSNKSLKYIDYYKSHEAVFVGVRKGDYHKEAKHYGFCSLEYYKNAIQYMKLKLHNPTFVFFSDNIEWVMSNFSAETLEVDKDEIIYRTQEDIVSNFEELFIMASCKHAIISNSTFNFWGAWLSDNSEKIVIAPQYWFGDGSPIDIIPDHWIKMNNKMGEE